MKTKFDGVKVTLGGRDLVLPPLSFRHIKALQGRLEGYKGGGDPESTNTVLLVAQTALSRNYDDITEDWLLDVLDLGNMEHVMRAAMDVSGLYRKELQAQEGASADPSTGTNSTVS